MLPQQLLTIVHVMRFFFDYSKLLNTMALLIVTITPSITSQFREYDSQEILSGDIDWQHQVQRRLCDNVLYREMV